MRPLRTALPGLVLLVALAACGSSGTSVDLSGRDFTDHTGESRFTIDAVDNNFRPEYVEVTAGTKVTFENVGRNRHNVIAIDDGFTTIETDEFTPDDAMTLTFDQTGDFPYYCSLHGTPTSGMIGGIRVVK